MSRKALFTTLATILIFALISANFQGTPAYAQGTPDKSDNEACDPQSPNPAATRLASALDVPVAQIMAWHCKNYGFGEIRKAYVLASLTTGKGMTRLTVDQIFAMRADGKGWGQIIKSTGLSMKDFNKAVRNAMKAEKMKPNKANNGKGNDNGNGKGKGKGQNGNDDKGNDNEKDDDD